MLPHKNTIIKFVLIIFLLAATVLSVDTFTKNIDADKLRISFFDIGQGDSIFIQTPSGIDIIIDGGPGNKILEELGKTMPFYDRKIDYMILTHPDSDHEAGLIEVLKKYRVKNILYTNAKKESPVHDEWLLNAKKEEAEIFIINKKTLLKLEDNLNLKIIYPDFDTENSTLNSNDTSIVARLDYGASSFLFTGDIEKEAINAIIKNDSDINTDILKVSHHGAINGTNSALLKKVTPKISIIQVGKNNFGHPSPRVMQQLKRAKSTTYRTDQKGTIKIISSGNGKYTIKF